MNSAQRNEIRDAYREWLSVFPFEMFATLTNRSKTSRARMRGKVREFISRLGPTAFAACGLESHILGGSHAHLLIGGVEGLTIREIRNRWTHGITTAERFRGGSGAASYLSKDLDVEFVGAFPA